MSIIRNFVSFIIFYDILENTKHNEDIFWKY
jgi:hypothetical protein